MAHLESPDVELDSFAQCRERIAYPNTLNSLLAKVLKSAVRNEAVVVEASKGSIHHSRFAGGLRLQLFRVKAAEIL